MKLGILGGGITGLTLQRFYNGPSEVLERAPITGGLCRTYFKDGFGYDVGGHILFSKDESINRLVEELLGDNAGRAKRANKIRFKDRFVKYPFENGLSALPKEDVYECLMGYLQRDQYPAPANLKQWCYQRFGKGIAEKYLIPYNEKIWNIAADQMSMGWVDRIPSPPLEDVVRSAVGVETEGYLHQLYFKYPKRGGVQALVDAVRKPDGQVTTNFTVTSIRRKQGQWHVSGSGGERAYDRLTVAFPIHEAIGCLIDVPDAVRDAVAGLRYNSINVVMIALNDPHAADYSAIYIPDPTVLPHRICSMGFFSPALVRPGTSSIIAEITTNPGDGVHELSNAAMTERTVADLHRIGLIDRAKVIVTDVVRERYGYPVYDLRYGENKRLLDGYFRSIDIQLCGRFAQFEYINSDECMRRAIALAKQYNAE